MDEKTIHEVITAFKNAFADMWKALSEALDIILEAREKIEHEESYRETWFVPMKITKNHQVLNRKPLLSNIRNSI